LKFGEIYWVHLPDRGGHEQRGRRPALIWQDTDRFPKLPTVLMIPLTSQLETIRFGGTVLIHSSISNGLKANSVALVFQLGACDIRRFESRMGKLSKSDLAKVRQAARMLQRLD
jgi:mRNA-degrading endonuclease toxin of MazEF toxin-antitoxin module